MAKKTILSEKTISEKFIAAEILDIAISRLVYSRSMKPSRIIDTATTVAFQVLGIAAALGTTAWDAAAKTARKVAKLPPTMLYRDQRTSRDQ